MVVECQPRGIRAFRMPRDISFRNEFMKLNETEFCKKYNNYLLSWHVFFPWKDKMNNWHKGFLTYLWIEFTEWLKIDFVLQKMDDGARNNLFVF